MSIKEEIELIDKQIIQLKELRKSLKKELNEIDKLIEDLDERND